MVDLVPGLELLIGQKPRPSRLPPAEARQRFSAVFGAFAAAFACPERPMLIVLEDGQWLDAASAAFLEKFTSPSLRFTLSVSGPW
jgi:predicted ATPase